MKILILEDNPIRIEKFEKLFKNQELDIASIVADAQDACLLNKYQVLWQYRHMFVTFNWNNSKTMFKLMSDMTAERKC